MRKIILVLFLSFSFQQANAVFDSLRVGICKSGGDCYGSPEMSKVVDHFDSLGNIIASEDYVIMGCDETWHHNDYDLVQTTTSQFTSDNKVSSYTVRFFNHSVITWENTTSYIYDQNGKAVSVRVITTVPISAQGISLDSSIYDANGDLVGHMVGIINSSGQLIDTSYIETFNYILPGVLSTYIKENFNLQVPTVTYLINSFDSLYNITCRYDSIGGDSAPLRTFFGYDSLNRKIEEWRKQFDPQASVWNIVSRFTYEYDSISGETIRYNFNCGDSMCADTISRMYYNYDLAGRLLSQHTESYFEGVWESDGGNSAQYNAFGNLIYLYNWYHVEVGCSHSHSESYTYNLLNQLTYSYSETIDCNIHNYECEYFNLNENALLVDVQNLSPVCENDTVTFVVAANGGQSPLTFHWSPGNMVSDSTIQSPLIFADTLSNTIFTLTVIDANGLSKSDTVQLIAKSIPIVSLGNDTIVCAGSTIVLDPGIYEDYLWQNTSANRLYYASSTVPDTFLYSVNVRGQNFCWNSDSVVVIFDICAAITEGISVNQNCIFPNPAKEFLTVHLDEFKSEENVYFSVSDQLGRVVLNKQLFSDSEKIDFKGIGKGIYSYLIFTSERKLDHGKLVLVD